MTSAGLRALNVVLEHSISQNSPPRPAPENKGPASHLKPPAFQTSGFQEGGKAQEERPARSRLPGPPGQPFKGIPTHTLSFRVHCSEDSLFFPNKQRIQFIQFEAADIEYKRLGARSCRKKMSACRSNVGISEVHIEYPA